MRPGQRDDEGPDDPVLLEAISIAIRQSGSIPFDEFMESVLYKEGRGYYESRPVPIGRSGDFYTASNVSAAFGGTLAEQIAECGRLLGGGALDLVELGAGIGTMAADILDRILERHPDLYHRVTYSIVERSSAMRVEQEKSLGAHCAAGRIRWVEGPEAVAPEGIVGCVISNEFYDALPVRVVARREGILLERRVGLRGDPPRPGWVELPAEDPGLIEYVQRYGAAPEEGTVAEVGLAARSYARRVARAMCRGFQITIDYGDIAARLYDPGFRPSGTLIAYHRHRTCDDPFERIGRQDLTAHVNFSALEDAGREDGLETLGLTTQDRFLVSLGLAEEISRLASSSKPADIKRRLAMMALIHPEGMGRIFRVLVQAKGVAPSSLRGLHDPYASPHREEAEPGISPLGRRL